MYRILALAQGSPASSYFWQIQPNLAVGKFLVGFPDLADFSTAPVHTEYMQLKVMKLVLACHHLSDLTVSRTPSHSGLN